MLDKGCFEVKMSTTTQVIGAFKKEVRDYVWAIHSEAKNRTKDALILFAELKALRDFWLELSRRPTRTFTGGNLPEGFWTTDARAQEANYTYRERVEIAQKGIVRAKKVLKRYGYKI
jgi:hypothetical protein